MPKTLEELFGAEERAKRGSDAEAEILWEMVCRLRALDDLMRGRSKHGLVLPPDMDEGLFGLILRILDGETE